MGRQGRELTPDDLPLPQRQSIDITHGGRSQFEGDRVIPVDKPLEADYLEALKFAEELVDVVLEVPQTVGDEQKPVLAYPVRVNDDVEWLQPGVPQPIRRKFLEVLLTSQPMRVSTQVVKGQGFEQNIIHRSMSRRFPVSIINDPNPKGAEWARRVVMQAG